MPKCQTTGRAFSRLITAARNSDSVIWHITCSRWVSSAHAVELGDDPAKVCEAGKPTAEFGLVLRVLEELELNLDLNPVPGWSPPPPPTPPPPTVFYVVVNPSTHTCKFGVSSGDGWSRLTSHRREGFTDVHFIRRDFPEAGALEDRMKVALREAGQIPARGSEYFHTDNLMLILSCARACT